MEQSDFWRPTSSDFIANPYPYYEELRANGEVFKAKSGDYVIIGYDACKKVLTSDVARAGSMDLKMQEIAKYGQKKNQNFDALREILSGMVVQMNDILHRTIRSTLSGSWPSQEKMRELAQKAVRDSIKDLPASFDAVEVLCKRIPLLIISSLLGLSERESIRLANDGLKVVQALDPYLSYSELLESQEAAKKLQDFIHSECDADQASRSSITKAIYDLNLEPSDIHPSSVIAFLFIAGYETTSTLLTSCLLELIKNPSHQKAIEEFGVRPFVKEILRVSSPVQITGRLTAEAMNLNGMEIPSRSTLTICLGAANTDPGYFPNPLEIDFTRNKFNHLAFGYGLHHCLGNQLAEMEAIAFVEAILPFLPKLKLEEDPELGEKFAIRSYKSVKMSIA